MKKNLILLFSILYRTLAFAQPATIDDSFPFYPAGEVKAIATQTDGKVILGGSFFTGITRRTTTSTMDATFNIGSGFNGDVTAVALQGDGRILVTGNFTTFNGNDCSSLIRLLSTGAIDTSFADTRTLQPGRKIVVQPDGKILFLDANGLNRFQSNGAIDASFVTPQAPAPFSFYKSDFCLLSSGKILLSRTANSKLFLLSSTGTEITTFNQFGAGVNGAIQSIDVQVDNKILIGGNFTTYNGVTRNYVARLWDNGSLDQTFNPSVGFLTIDGGNVMKVQHQANNQILAAGKFITYNGISRNNLVRINTDGSIDATFNPGPGFNAPVNQLHLRPNEGILCGGTFSTYNGLARPNLICLKNDGAGMIPDGNESIANGCTPNPVTLTGPIPVGALYQWYSKAGVVAAPVVNSVAGWTTITGAKSNSYAPGKLTSSTSFACRVTINGKTNWAFGVRSITVALIDLKGSLTSGNQTLTSPADPAPITMSTLPVYNVQSTYQWYYKDGAASQPTGSSTTGWTLIPEGTVRNYDPPAGLTSSRSYALLVTYAPSAKCTSIGWASGVRKITVTVGAGSSGSLVAGDKTICFGGDPASIVFLTAATGPSLSYQWYYKDGLASLPSGTSIVGWKVITGAISSSYDPPAGLTLSRTYGCFVKANATDVGWASGVRQITVLPAFNPGTITSGDQTMCANSNPANITLSVNPVGSGAYTYRWYYKESTASACPAGTDGTTNWIASTGTTNAYDPQSAGANGRTFALRVTPAGVPACSVPMWANGCRKIFVIPCREGVDSGSEEESSWKSESQMAKMEQNQPNPWTEHTCFSVFLPENTTDSEIRISGLDGRLHKVIAISGTGNQKIELKKGDLPVGLYLYCLWTNQQPVAMKKMVLIR